MVSRRACCRFGRTGAPRRRLGVTLAELVLYMTVTMGVLVFTISIIQQESERQSRSLAAGDLQMAVEGAQLYVASRYDSLVDRMFDDAGSADPMFRRIPMTELYDSGYLPRALEPGKSVLSREFEQDMALYVRAVLRDDPAPKPTVTPTDVDTDGNGAIDDRFVDRLDDNDQIDLEAVLLADGAWLANAAEGLRIARLSEQPAAGVAQFVEQGTDRVLVARGVGGAWELDLEPMRQTARLAGLDADNGNLVAADAPTPDAFRVGEGYVAALVALPNFGVMTSYGNPREAEDMTGLRLCPDEVRGTPGYEDCISGGRNTLMNNIVMNEWDEDGDGFVDGFPRFESVFNIEMASPSDVRTDPALPVRDSDIPQITGLTFLQMRDPYASVPGDPIDRFPTITDVTRITMTGRTDAAVDPGVEDFRYASIENAAAITCDPAATGALADGRMLLDCAETRISERLIVDRTANEMRLEGDATFTADVTVSDTLELTRGAPGDPFTRLRPAEIFVSDGPLLSASFSDVEWLNAGDIDLDALMLISGDEAYDVTENAMLRTEAIVAPDEGDSVDPATPSCPSGWNPVVDLVSVTPPGTYSVGGQTYNTVDRIDIAEDSSGYTADVTYSSRGSGLSGACESVCERTYLGNGTFGPIVCTVDEASCNTDTIFGTPVTVPTPADTVFTFRIGCVRE